MWAAGMHEQGPCAAKLCGMRKKAAVQAAGKGERKTVAAFKERGKGRGKFFYHDMRAFTPPFRMHSLHSAMEYMP